MRITQNQKIKTFLILFVILLSAPVVCPAEVALTVTGMGAVEDSNLTKAEQQALQDAFAKAMLQVALRQVPNSSVPDLVHLLPEFIASRRMQDIVQYQIVSRSQQNGVLQLSVDVKLNDDPLKEWINVRALATPVGLRPKMLLMISYLEPGKSRPSEWWTSKAGSAYSPFETQFANELNNLGENVIAVSHGIRGAQPGIQSPQDIARLLGADMLLTGSLAYSPLLNKVYDCSFKATLIDLKSQATLSSWSISHKGDLAVSTMNSLMINEVIKQVRAPISAKITSRTHTMTKKDLCIEGIRDYGTYQSMINTLKSTGNVSRIIITSINGHSHSVCHSMELTGSLSDALENLRSKQIAEADVIVEDDKAYVRIIQ